MLKNCSKTPKKTFKIHKKFTKIQVIFNTNSNKYDKISNALIRTPTCNPNNSPAKGANTGVTATPDDPTHAPAKGTNTGVIPTPNDLKNASANGENTGVIPNTGDIPNTDEPDSSIDYLDTGSVSRHEF